MPINKPDHWIITAIVNLQGIHEALVRDPTEGDDDKCQLLIMEPAGPVADNLIVVSRLLTWFVCKAVKIVEQFAGRPSPLNSSNGRDLMFRDEIYRNVVVPAAVPQ
jgi:hypothetical protein